MATIHDTFDPVKERLAGTNLIEASAGTGKTYSIAIIALRLVIEQGIPLKGILMVTYTRFAVAELELRIRSFFRQAVKASRGEPIDDKTIAALVESLNGKLGSETVGRRLESALLSLDDTSIMTIHSFCHQVLKEYAFETGQVFGSEIMDAETEGASIERSFREFWRRQVTTLPVEVLDSMRGDDMNYDSLLGLIRKCMGGMVPLFGKGYAKEPDDTIGILGRAVGGFVENHSVIHALRDELVEAVKSDVDRYIGIVEKATETSNHFREILIKRQWGELGDKFVASPQTRYTKKAFADLDVKLQEIRECKQRNESLKIAIKELIGWGAYRHVADRLAAYKSMQGGLSYDDMLTRVESALTTGASVGPLVEAVRKKYRAVAVDEYQDTDRVQSRIFEILFGEDTTLFYIGDPKQSIYAFRKADIATYLATSDKVNDIYRMNLNFRSTEAYIGAMNAFFKPTPDTDTFAFEGEDRAIEYIEVKSPDPNTRGRMTLDGGIGEGIFISRHPDREGILGGVLKIVKGLLYSGRYGIEDGRLDSTVIRPSDIGILVRSNDEGREIKRLLARHRIPAVTIDDSKVFGSSEAADMLYILMAAYEPSRSNINRALLTGIAGYDTEALLSSDGDALVERFRLYQETWKEQGVYVMMRRFMADHAVEEMVYSDEPAMAEYRSRRPENPERALSNILQLTEILHNESQRRNYDMREQIQWFGMGIEGEARSGDEYIQRIESDEDAVEIITIHKSKGLEYNIVIAPYLDMKHSDRHKVVNFRDEASGCYHIAVSGALSDEAKEMSRRQVIQENRRLLYVAITRARYASFVTAHVEEEPPVVADEPAASDNQKKKGKGKSAAIDMAGEPSDSALGYFLGCIDALTSCPPQLHRDWKIPDDYIHAERRKADRTGRAYAVARSFSSNLRQQSWRKASYTYLNPEHDTVPLLRRDVDGHVYDEFVFNGIRRGAHTGNLLHYIFERMDFRSDSRWDNVVEAAIARLASRQPDGFTERMREMLSHLTRVELVPGTGLCLSAVEWVDRISELEFDFPLSLFQTDGVVGLSTPETPIRMIAGEELEGIMNGKIDLLFRHGGRFYILDWKSNHLGYSQADYCQEGMAASMKENNYHLQYLIYTVAVRRYLATRMPTFDYERDFGGVVYLFVRGVREGSDTGVFFRKPEKALVDRFGALISPSLNLEP